MVALSFLAWTASWISDLLRQGRPTWATSKSRIKPKPPAPRRTAGDSESQREEAGGTSLTSGPENPTFRETYQSWESRMSAQSRNRGQKELSWPQSFYRGGSQAAVGPEGSARSCIERRFTEDGLNSHRPHRGPSPSLPWREPSLESQTWARCPSLLLCNLTSKGGRNPTPKLLRGLKGPSPEGRRSYSEDISRETLTRVSPENSPCDIKCTLYEGGFPSQKQRSPGTQAWASRRDTWLAWKEGTLFRRWHLLAHVRPFFTERWRGPNS